MRERDFVEADHFDEVQKYHPDVMVVEYLRGRKGNGQSTAAVVGLAEPVILPIDDEKLRQGYIEIVDTSSGNRVVTVIEFLSPTNKIPGEGQEQYLKKQQDFKYSKTNYVEIDLTRRGHRQLMISRTPPRHRTTFQACVRRARVPIDAELYRIPLQAPLPKIPIPLRKKDVDVTLDLQALIEKCYRNGRYDSLDYTVPPNPPLSPADAKWAAALLKKHAKSRR